MVEGAPHTVKERLQRSTCVVVRCPPTPVYKGGRGEVRPAPRGALGGVLIPPGVGLPLLALVEKEKGGGERGKGGAAPPLPCPIQTRGGGGARPALAGPPLLPHGPLRPINPREGSGNPPVFR